MPPQPVFNGQKMVKINNSDLIKEVVNGAGIQSANDLVPNILGNTVIPVMETNPALLRRCEVVRSSSATNATTATIYTTPADQDFYLVSCQVSVIKDITSTSTYSRVNITINGASQAICMISSLTLTTQNQSVAQNFNPPIKIDRNTAISTVLASSTVGVKGNAANIYGYVL